MPAITEHAAVAAKMSRNGRNAVSFTLRQGYYYLVFVVNVNIGVEWANLVISREITFAYYVNKELDK